MVGVGYGKGVGLPEERVRWLSPADVEAKQLAGGNVRFFDARDDHEWREGSVPGAESLPQTSLMFMRDRVQPLLDDLLSGASGADELVFFANTAGRGDGMTSGRDVYVMAFLLELGLPLERMARLEGGLNGWSKSGRPTPAPASPGREHVDTLEALLGFAGNTSDLLAHGRPSR